MAVPNSSVPDAPTLQYAFAARVDVGPIIDVGEVTGGRRRVIPIRGGTFEGPRLRGRVLPGADWQVVHDGTLTELEARYLLETDSGSLVAIVNRGATHRRRCLHEWLRASRSTRRWCTSARWRRSGRPTQSWHG